MFSLLMLKLFILVLVSRPVSLGYAIVPLLLMIVAAAALDLMQRFLIASIVGVDMLTPETSSSSTFMSFLLLSVISLFSSSPPSAELNTCENDFGSLQFTDSGAVIFDTVTLALDGERQNTLGCQGKEMK